MMQKNWHNGNWTGLTPVKVMLALVFLVPLAVNLNTLLNGFVYDDEFIIIGNRWLRDISNLPEIFSSSMWGFKTDSGSNYYRPLVHLVLMAEYKVFGLNAWGYHLVNAIVNSLNACLVFLISFRLFSACGRREEGFAASLIAALIFGVHPVHAEAVAPASVIAELTLSSVYFLCLYAYMLSGDAASGKRRSVLLASSALLFLAGLFLKETAVTLAAAIFLYDFLIRKGQEPLSRFMIKTLPRYLPFALSLAVYFIARGHALGGIVPEKQNQYLTGYQAVLNIIPLLADYLRLLFAPFGLKAFYSFHPVLAASEVGFFPAAAALLLSGLAAYLLIASKRLELFALIWAAAALSPALYIPGVGARGSVFAERYLYIPSAGFVILFSILLLKASALLSRAGQLRTALTAAALITVFFSALSFSRNTVWHSNYTLWKDASTKTTDSAVVYINLGSAAQGLGKEDEAVSAYSSALDISPYSPELHNNIGTVYAKKGEYGKAIESFKRAYAATDNFEFMSTIKSNIGEIYLKKGMQGEALAEFNDALMYSPGDPAIIARIKAAESMQKK